MTAVSRPSFVTESAQRQGKDGVVIASVTLPSGAAVVCPACTKEISPDGYFCIWCDRLVIAPERGVKAGLFARWVALVIDPLIGLLLYFLAVAVLASVSTDLATIAAIALPFAYFIWFLTLLRSGTTPGKRLMGLQVVRTQTGGIPGFGVMFVREVVGRFVSGVFLGLGYLWAVFDRNGQAWHDKIASTVVVRVDR